jgi:hypothetical protein
MMDRRTRLINLLINSIKVRVAREVPKFRKNQAQVAD